MVKMVALKAGRYGARHVEVGQEFEVSPKYGDILFRIKKAYPADAQVTEVKSRRKPAKPNVASADAAATVAPKAPIEGPIEEPKASLTEAVKSSAIVDDDDIDTLRLLYAEMTGQAPDGRWSARTLKEKIAEARATYQTRDMQAGRGFDFG